MNSLIAIVGPTAIGKSSIALELARNFDGEIVNADSRQVYRYMDIGTAKPSLEDQGVVNHHLIDIVDPDQDFNLALYQTRAFESIDSIRSKGKNAFLVGGSGLYVWSILEGWSIPPVPPDPVFRKTLEKKARHEGNEALYQELVKMDPVAADRIDPRNTRRVIRALEVCSQGALYSQLQTKKEDIEALIIGLTANREDLYRKIDNRVDDMISKGLVAEVEGLVANGYGTDLPSMTGLGYKQIGMFLRNEMDLSPAIQQIKYDTHHFARRQYNWFRLRDIRIKWFEIGEETGRDIRRIVRDFIAG